MGVKGKGLKAQAGGCRDVKYSIGNTVNNILMTVW